MANHSRPGRRDSPGSGASPAHTASDLLQAAAKGDAQLVTALLSEVQAAPNLERNCTAALFVAAQSGHARVVSVLLDHGVSPSTAARNGATPLYVAVSPVRFEPHAKLFSPEAPTAAPVMLYSWNFVAETAPVAVAKWL